jgi:hypothetical protein
MPIQLPGNAGTVMEVDGTTFRAMRVTNRPADYGALGFYQAAMNSGTLAAALAANTELFQFRWTDATRFAVVHYISLTFQPLTLFTAATLTDFGFDAFVARAWSAVGTGGTAATLTGNSFKTRTGMGTTLLNDMRISTTAALGAGTKSIDANPFAASVGKFQRVNPAAGTEETYVNIPTLTWAPQVSNGEAPLVLAGTGNGEGFILRNRGVWPAAGTGEICVNVRWGEYTAY